MQMPPVLLVRYARHVVAEEPQHGVGGGFTRRAGADHVADEGDREAFCLQFLNLLHRAGDAVLMRRQAVAGHFVHGQRVQRNIRAGPGIGGGGEVVGVGFAGDFENGDLDRLRHFRAAGEPLAVGPGLHARLAFALPALAFSATSWKASNISRVCLSSFAASCAQLGVVEQGHQCLDVVAAVHLAQQFHGELLVDQRRLALRL